MTLENLNAVLELLKIEQCNLMRSVTIDSINLILLLICYICILYVLHMTKES